MNGLNIKGPPVVVEGDNITVECGASKYNYHQNIRWVHKKLNNEEEYPLSNNNRE